MDEEEWRRAGALVNPSSNQFLHASATKGNGVTEWYEWLTGILPAPAAELAGVSQRPGAPD